MWNKVRNYSQAIFQICEVKKKKREKFQTHSIKNDAPGNGILKIPEL